MKRKLRKFYFQNIKPTIMSFLPGDWEPSQEEWAKPASANNASISRFVKKKGQNVRIRISNVSKMPLDTFLFPVKVVITYLGFGQFFLYLCWEKYIQWLSDYRLAFDPCKTLFCLYKILKYIYQILWHVNFAYFNEIVTISIWISFLQSINVRFWKVPQFVKANVHALLHSTWLC